MPNTRKKTIKTVYKCDDSDSNEIGDFSDSGSDAHISDQSDSTEHEESECEVSTAKNEIKQKSKPRQKRGQGNKTAQKTLCRPRFGQNFVDKITKQKLHENDDEYENNSTSPPATFSVKDLTDADKLLPSILNLSESDSSDEEPTTSMNNGKKNTTQLSELKVYGSDHETPVEYKDVWSNNIEDNSEEIAKKAFMQLQQHAEIMEQAKTSVKNYTIQEHKNDKSKEHNESDVKDLLALGEEVTEQSVRIKKKKNKKVKHDSDSDIDDWEEVKESKPIPKQGIQLVVNFPDASYRKSKEVDVEMMMRRKINRVKKEYQVYMHKVHVLCWLAHGNYVSKILNNQEVLAAALSLFPSKNCYPGERVDLKYVTDLTTWFQGKIILKQDKNEDKFRPKAPQLNEILVKQITSGVVTTKKYLVFIFVSMLRALGLQCRIMFNFVTIPLKPPTSELCSLSTKNKKDVESDKLTSKGVKVQNKHEQKSVNKDKQKPVSIPQLDGKADDSDYSLEISDHDFENINQLDGGDDKPMKSKSVKNKLIEEDVSPPKRLRSTTSLNRMETRNLKNRNVVDEDVENKRSKKSTHSKHISTEVITKEMESLPPKRARTAKVPINTETKYVNATLSAEAKVTFKGQSSSVKEKIRYKKASEEKKPKNDQIHSQNTQQNANKTQGNTKSKTDNVASKSKKITCDPPNIIVSTENNIHTISSKYFDSTIPQMQNQTSKIAEGKKKLSLSRKRFLTTTTEMNNEPDELHPKNIDKNVKSRTKSAPGNLSESSKYFSNTELKPVKDHLATQADAVHTRTGRRRKITDCANDDDSLRISHKELASTSKDKSSCNVNIMATKMKDIKTKLKGKDKLDNNSDIRVNKVKHNKHSPDSEDDFKPSKITVKALKRKIDRRVLSSDEESSRNLNKMDVWCEVFVEELEQWITVDIIKKQVHCTKEVYARATHPVTYVVGWDNSNHLKDLTRRYVPHWNTVTRKQRAEPLWWSHAIKPWLGPATPRDKEEDESLDQLQLEAPLPKSIAEYKNHPLYALRRHLLKFEALYPADAAPLGYVRGEPVYARATVYVCRSRDTWLKEAKVVRAAQLPYKVVKARPKWDKLSNKMITDQPLEVFGPWQVQDYEPPVAENGIVPRNAYGNVELFKECMLPKGTVHIKLPALNKVARKLNIDCAPAMTGFDFNGGWSHPVYDGFVVCKEFEEIITDAWVKDQEEQERRERDKIESRVYGNWKRLIKGLFIRERLKIKYGFEDPSMSSDNKKKSKGPRLVVKKRS